jgi:dipeptidyl-peptidase 4
LKRARFVLVLAMPCCLSALAAPYPQQPPLTVEQIYHERNLLAEPPQEITWSPDGAQISYIDSQGALIGVNRATGASKVLVNPEKMQAFRETGASERDQEHRARYQEPSYIWLPDSRHLLFDANEQLWFFDLGSGVGVPLAATHAGSGANPQTSPDGSAISYIRDQDLYVLKLRQSDAPVRLTESTAKTVLNGEVDWVYEEELDVRGNYFWSPDSKRLAYLQSNESEVPEYPIVDWIPAHATIDGQRYPQPGDPNPSVRVGVVSPNGGKTKWINLPIHSGSDYIPRFGWVNDTTLWIETLTRDQKEISLYFADVTNDNTQLILTKSDDKFLDESYDVRVLEANILLTGWRDGHTHIYLYSFDKANPLAKPATLAKQLTSGNWDVAGISAVDAASQTVYYLSNESGPSQQELWAVKMDGTGRRRISTAGGWHNPVFSPDAKSFADTFSSANTPPAVELCAPETRCKSIWKAPPTGLQLITPIDLSLKAADGSTVLYGRIVLPRGRTTPASVPLILNPYGGPVARTVTDQWSARTLLFDQVLAEHGYAVLHVDNRGMGGRGRDFAQAAYHNLGPVQFSDQMAALDQVLAKYPQLDLKRLGWWGWSWGGTFTLYAMTHSSRFDAGVAVAPVTDWGNYDSIYTERYLGEPIDDANAYRDDSVVLSAHNLKGRVLLAQGTGDDNVHLGNSVQFIQQLIAADIPYDLQIYPRKLHGISGAAARTRLYDSILEHFEIYLPSGHREAGGPAQEGPQSKYN